MTELARFRWAGAEWALLLSAGDAPCVLVSSRDQRTYHLVPPDGVGRVIPTDAVGRWPTPRDRDPFHRWAFAVVLLGDEERRFRLYAPWPLASVHPGIEAPIDAVTPRALRVADWLRTFGGHLDGAVRTLTPEEHAAYRTQARRVAALLRAWFQLGVRLTIPTWRPVVTLTPLPEDPIANAAGAPLPGAMDGAARLVQARGVPAGEGPSSGRQAKVASTVGSPDGPVGTRATDPGLGPSWPATSGRVVRPASAADEFLVPAAVAPEPVILETLRGEVAELFLAPDPALFWVATSWLAVHAGLLDADALATHVRTLAPRPRALAGALVDAAVALASDPTAVAAALRPVRDAAAPSPHREPWVVRRADVTPGLPLDPAAEARGALAPEVHPAVGRWGVELPGLIDVRHLVESAEWLAVHAPQVAVRCH